MKTLEVKLMQPRDDTKSRCTTETRVKDDGCTCTLSDSAAGNTENKKMQWKHDYYSSVSLKQTNVNVMQIKTVIKTSAGTIQKLSLTSLYLPSDKLLCTKLNSDRESLPLCSFTGLLACIHFLSGSV